MSTYVKFLLCNFNQPSFRNTKYIYIYTTSPLGKNFCSKWKLQSLPIDDAVSKFMLKYSCNVLMRQTRQIILEEVYVSFSYTALNKLGGSYIWLHQLLASNVCRPWLIRTQQHLIVTSIITGIQEKVLTIHAQQPTISRHFARILRSNIAYSVSLCTVLWHKTFFYRIFTCVHQ